MKGIADTRPCEKTNDPTPRSIRETPKDSHFANIRGNTGKSTAGIASTVISIMCALYTDKDIMNGNRREFCLVGEEMGAWLLGERLLEGSGDVISRRGKNESRAIVGMPMRMQRVMGAVAKSVMESRSGRTRRNHCTV